MNAPLIHGIRKAVSASRILEALGDALSRIRQEDRLTWSEIGSLLGKSEDQAAKYADASAEMGAVACFRAWDLWGERFSGQAKALFANDQPRHDPQAAQTSILKAALALSVALEDGELTVEEIRSNRGTLERAKEAIDCQLTRLRPAGVGA